MSRSDNRSSSRRPSRTESHHRNVECCSRFRNRKRGNDLVQRALPDAVSGSDQRNDHGNQHGEYFGQRNSDGNLVAPANAAGPALVDHRCDGNPSNPNCNTASPCAISPLIYGMNAYLLDQTTAQNTNITVARWGGDATSRYNYQNANSNSAADYYFQNGGTYGMLTTNSNSTTSESNFNDFIAETTALGIKSIGTAPVLGYVSNSSTSACSFPKSTYPNQQSYDSSNCGNGVVPQGVQIPNITPATTCSNSSGCRFLGNSTTWQTTSIKCRLRRATRTRQQHGFLGAKYLDRRLGELPAHQRHQLHEREWQ